MAKAFKATNKQMDKPFNITSVCRADIAGAMGDEIARRLDDDDMKRIASKMADAYCDNGFWIDLPIIVEHVAEDYGPLNKEVKE